MKPDLQIPCWMGAVSSPQLVATALELAERARASAYQVGLAEAGLRSIIILLEPGDLEKVIEAMRLMAKGADQKDEEKRAETPQTVCGND